MIRRVGLVGLAGLLSLLSAQPALAKPAQVEVGKVRLVVPAKGRGALLVPVSYPIQLLGRRVELDVSLRRAGGGPIRAWAVRARASGGAPRLPERRRSFTFVHRVELGARLTRRIRRGLRPLVHVHARAAMDVDGDGRAELDSADDRAQALRPASDSHGLCSTIPQLRTRPGRRTATPLPTCVDAVSWKITRAPEHGSARIRGGELIYTPSARFRGSDAIRLSGGAWAQVKVGSAGGVVVRAMGDSVTAGFGYYDNGKLMPFTSLRSCEPGETFYNDACSSNSVSRDNGGKKVEYASDYGLADNVSWAAQWANAHGVANYENLAVSGSEPSDWLPEGQLFETAKRIEAEDPDYIPMTMGANPLLSEMLFGTDNMGCAIESDITGGYRECIEEAFEKVHLRANLKQLYGELVAKTEATIFLMQYHLSIPSSALAYSATQIAMMGVLLNETIASVASEVAPKRLRVVAPPYFAVGIEMEPVHRNSFSCSRLGFEVDGQSVQSEPTQDELEISHPLSFCEGPAEGPPWVISGDTGIHPSAAGYAQMASRVPAPE